MKKLLYLSLMATAITGLALAKGPQPTEQATVENKLRGTWLGVSGHWGTENPAESRGFTFMTNHQFSASIDQEIITGTYRIAVTNEPFQIDFTFKFKDKTVTTLTIFDFPKDDHLRIAEWDPSFRRKRFRPGITFRKRKTSNK